MIIASNILFAFLILMYCGFVAIFFSFSMKRQNRPPNLWAIIPSIGYVFTQLFFWILYIPFSNSSLSMIILFFAFTTLFIIYIVITSKNKSWCLIKDILPLKKDFFIILIFFAIVIVSSWQYFLIGEGNYFHSGNEDFFDGITGGNTYLSNTPISKMLHDFKIGWPIQYSSQTFWRILLGLNGVDTFLIQSIINLILTSLGVYWLVLSVFKGSMKIALLSAFWSVAANFYMTTYLNGHIGSMMYGSVAPVFIGLLILWIRKEIEFYWFFLVLVILVFLHFTYPGPIYFLIIPAVLLFVHDRILLANNYYEKFFNFLNISKEYTLEMLFKKIKWERLLVILFITVILLILSTWYVYDFFEPRRIQALLRTNVSWKISLYKEMFPIFWGVYPSGSTGTLSVLPLFISSEIINNIALIFALTLTLLAFIAGLRIVKNKRREFLFIYTILFIPYLIMMRYFWGSPYYFYKFLYINYFLIIIIFFLWLERFYNSEGKKFFKKLLLFILLFLGALNLLWNVAIGFDYYTRPYNVKDKIDNFIKNTQKKDLTKASLDIPNWINDMVFSYIFNEKGLQLSSSRLDAKYLIQLKNYGTVFHNSLSDKKIVYKNDLLSLIEKPTENTESIITLYEPEFYGKVDINWVGNDLSIKNFVIQSSVNEVVDYVSRRGTNFSYFFDIVDKDVFLLLDRALRSKNILLKYSLDKETVFIQLKTNESFFNIYGKEKVVWQNEIFKLKAYPNDTKIEVKELKEKFDFSGLVSSVKANGNSVFLDFPKTDPVSLYLTQHLTSKGIIIENDANKTQLVCRYFFEYPFESYINNTITSPREELLWRSSSFNINKRYWEVELYNIPIDDRTTTSFNNKSNLPVPTLLKRSTGDFQLTLSNLSDDARFLRLLVCAGPSIDFADFYLNISDKNNIINIVKKIVAPKTLIDIPIDNNTRINNELILKIEAQNLIGKSLLPLDDRYLNFQIQALELTDQIDTYSEYMINALNNPVPSRFDRLYRVLNILKETEDIIQSKEGKTIFFGIGWHSFEKFGGEKFRWIGANPAELVINKKLFSQKNIVLDLEPGPGNNNQPLPIEFLIANKSVMTDTLNQRKKISLNFSDYLSENDKDFLTIKLIPHSRNVRSGGDTRVLNFRVFNISTN